MSSVTVRVIVALWAICALAVLASGGSASAATLSTPSGMKTISNTPSLAWQVAANEIADQVRISKSPAVDANGQLVSRYTSLSGDELTTVGLTGGNTSDWAGSAAAPLWPGAYYWQVLSTVTAEDGTTTTSWTAPRKVVVTMLIAEMASSEGIFKVAGQSATQTVTAKIRTNLKSVPFSITFRLNGHVYCTNKKPYTRVSDIGQLVATVPLSINLKRSYYQRGRNTITVTGSIGSKATTGKVEKINSTQTFTLR